MFTSEMFCVYDEKHRQFLNGQITETVWRKFCSVYLCYCLKENQEVFIRLKNR